MGNDVLPFVVMVMVQLMFAGMTVLTKVVMDAGMDPNVQIAYRLIFATISLAPFAFFFERKTRPKLTPSILFYIFLAATFGLTANQHSFFIGLNNSTATIAGALDNLIPAFTFIIAILLGLEKLGLRSLGGRAKLVGTIICIGGGMVLSLYHGKVVIGQLGFHWKYADRTSKDDHSDHSKFFTGPFLLIISSLTYSIWIIIQTKVNKKFAAPYTSIGLTCLMASVESVIIGFCVVHKTSEWTLNPSRAGLVVYNGVVCTGMAYYLTSWCIEKKGPLYVSMFNPLLLVICAFFSWALLREKLYMGVVVGSILTVIGLYIFLWGKKKEMEPKTEDVKEGKEEEKVHEVNQPANVDLELQLPEKSDSNSHYSK